MAKLLETQVVTHDPELPARLREEAEALQVSDSGFDANLAESFLHVAEELEFGNSLTLLPPEEALVRKKLNGEKELVSYIEVNAVGGEFTNSNHASWVSEDRALNAAIGVPLFFGAVFQDAHDALAALDMLSANRSIVFEAFPAMRPETAYSLTGSSSPEAMSPDNV